MSQIQKLLAREILDSRGYPTVEVDIFLNDGTRGRASVPSGASTGTYEAYELRDQNKARYLGKGVLQAVANLQNIIFPALKNFPVDEPEKLDELLKKLDGTPNKKNLGANAILGVSLAYAHACAASQKKPLFSWLNPKSTRLPIPLMNVINGGAHANNGLNVQEFMVIPVCGGRFSESLRAGVEVFHQLKKILQEHHLSTAVGDEGGFAPQLKNNQQALDLLLQAIEKAGYQPGRDIFLGLDVAASEFYQEGKYEWEGQRLTSQELSQIYASWQKDYPLVSIEDGFAEDDWQGWTHFTQQHGHHLQLVGDDLFVTNPQRLAMGIERGAANALLVKVNQIGSLTETKAAVEMAHKHQYRTVMSHRSGETEDTTIADLAVGLNCQQIKTGSLCRSERTCKYNQLLRIEELLGARAEYWGQEFLFKP